jgi:CubicO group peptidase (beta-lactamase class C family)
MPVTANAQQQLWSPLGMEYPAVSSLDREDGMEKAWCCIAGTARDLAKLGRLHLHRGLAGEPQVLSETSLNHSAPGPPARAGAGRALSLSWWPASPQWVDYVAVGKCGQFLYIDPAPRTVVVRLGKSFGPLGK